MLKPQPDLQQLAQALLSLTDEELHVIKAGQSRRDG
jgi:hypothetical protein